MYWIRGYCTISLDHLLLKNTIIIFITRWTYLTINLLNQYNKHAHKNQKVYSFNFHYETFENHFQYAALNEIEHALHVAFNQFVLDLHNSIWLIKKTECTMRSKTFMPNVCPLSYFMTLYLFVGLTFIVSTKNSH